jgi:hypothetical protein
MKKCVPCHLLVPYYIGETCKINAKEEEIIRQIYDTQNVQFIKILGPVWHHGKLPT